MLAWLGQGKGRLLDVGAADGLLSCAHRRRWRVTGLEGDPALAEAGRAYCERMFVGDLDRDIPDFDAPFDAIVYGDVLEHLIDPLRTVQGLNRWLAPGARVVLSVPNVAHLLIPPSLLVGRFDYVDRGILDRTHLRFFHRPFAAPASRRGRTGHRAPDSTAVPALTGAAAACTARAGRPSTR